jgi:hypothetical protein
VGSNRILALCFESCTAGQDMLARRACLDGCLAGPFKIRMEANVADDPTPTVTEEERTTLEERQRALAAAAAAVKDGVANYNACLAALQEVAAAIAARLRAAYEAGSSDPLSRGALITDLDAIASMTALNATLLGLTDPPPI